MYQSVSQSYFDFYSTMHTSQCKARSCDRMSSVRLSVRPSMLDIDHIGSVVTNSSTYYLNTIANSISTANRSQLFQ